MTSATLRSLRGRQVNVALTDGTRIDDCLLLSSGRPSTSTVWLVSNGADVFVRREDVIAVWGVVDPRLAA